MSDPARVTVSRQDPGDIGSREIFVSLDGEELAILRHGESVTRELAPGAHELRVHNTLFRKHATFTLADGEEARYRVVNKSGWGTMAMVSVLGAGPVYLTLERESTR
jgi:hypothetical protein